MITTTMATHSTTSAGTARDAHRRWVAVELENCRRTFARSRLDGFPSPSPGELVACWPVGCGKHSLRLCRTGRLDEAGMVGGRHH